MYLTSQYQSDESKEPVADEEDDARENDVSDVRLDMMHNDRLQLLTRTNHKHQLLLR